MDEVGTQTVQHESQSEVSVSIYKTNGKLGYSIKVPISVPRSGEKTTGECVEEAYTLCLEYWKRLETETG